MIQARSCSAQGVFIIKACTLALSLFFFRCSFDPPQDPSTPGSGQRQDFPLFITPVEDYFDIRIGEIPDIDGESYQLRISGAVDHPATYTLQELREMPLTEKTTTSECIENPVSGPLLGNATWKGIRIYDLIENLGLKPGASTVKYVCADGYYTFNTLEELKAGGVLGALYMNGSIIPDTFGFPVRIIFPGYYGVRQPGWIVEIEILEGDVEDYWSRSGWRTDTAMAVDSKIFFPQNLSRFNLGDSIRIGGAAFGGRRIAKVEITDDFGNTWMPAAIIQEIDEDHVWIFWKAIYIPQSSGSLYIYARATAMDGSVQPGTDDNIYDGTNAWPWINITVGE